MRYIEILLICFRGDLLELKASLDPLDKNPAVDSITFYDALSKWTEKLRENTEADEHNITPKLFVYIYITLKYYELFFRFNTLIDRNVLQSTPISVAGCFRERGLLNISDISAYSIEDAG